MSDEKCSKCGSARVVDDVEVRVNVLSSEKEVLAIVYGDPKAMFWKERSIHPMRARICGACGLTELYAERPEKLYDVVHRRDRDRQR